VSTTNPDSMHGGAARKENSAPAPSRTPASLMVVLVVVAWVALAVFLASLIGTGDFGRLKLAAFAIGGVVYLLFGLRWTWAIGFAICMFDLWLLGFGFKVSSTETAMAFCGGVALLVSWRKAPSAVPAICRRGAYRALKAALLGYLLYLLGHFAFNHLSPFHAAEYSPKHFARSVAAAGAAFTTLWVLLQFPRTVLARRTFPSVLGVVLLGALLFNIAARLYEFSGGSGLLLNDSGVPVSFLIPVLEAAPNSYALRHVPLLGLVLGMGFLGSEWIRRHARGTTLLFRAVVALSLAGAALSGGRATILMSFGLLVFTSLQRRRYALAACTVAALALLTAAVNAVPEQLNRLPWTVQRSLALLVFTDRPDARADIDSSSQWRWEVFQRALGEWRSDRRTLWFGRGTFAWTEADERLARADAFHNGMDTAIRRGATHNLLTDLLVVHGLVGLGLYALALVALERFLSACRRELPGDDPGHALAGCCRMLLLIFTGMSLFGGSHLPASVAWLAALLVGHLYQRERAAASPPVAPAPRFPVGTALAAGPGR